MSWIATSERLPDEGAVVETKIDDAKGMRNESLLKRRGNLWFVDDGSMYVYYRPTHWKPADPQKVAHRIEERINRLDAEREQLMQERAKVGDPHHGT